MKLNTPPPGFARPQVARSDSCVHRIVRWSPGTAPPTLVPSVRTHGYTHSTSRYPLPPRLDPLPRHPSIPFRGPPRSSPPARSPPPARNASHASIPSIPSPGPPLQPPQAEALRARTGVLLTRPGHAPMERCGQLRRGPLLEPLPLPRYLYGGGGGGDGSGPGGGPGVSAAPPGFAGNESSPLPPPPLTPRARPPGPEPGPGAEIWGALGSRKLCTLDAKCISQRKP
jgi:hypothetical protein